MKPLLWMLAPLFALGCTCGDSDTGSSDTSSDTDTDTDTDTDPGYKGSSMTQVDEGWRFDLDSSEFGTGETGALLGSQNR